MTCRPIRETQILSQILVELKSMRALLSPGPALVVTALERHPDASLIDALGGPTAVADLLGYDKRAGGVQRVQNWLTRGIPAAVKVQRPDLFLNQVPASKAA